MTTTADRIRQGANKLGMTYEEIARLSGVSRSAVHRYATGVCQAPVDRLEKIAAALNTTAPILLGWTEGEDNTGARAEWDALYTAYKAADAKTRRLVRYALENAACDADDVNIGLEECKNWGGAMKL